MKTFNTIINERQTETEYVFFPNEEVGSADYRTAYFSTQIQQKIKMNSSSCNDPHNLTITTIAESYEDALSYVKNQMAN